MNINENKNNYEEFIKMMNEAKEQDMPFDEGLGKALFGGLAGATIGPSVMKALCKVLGITENGTLGSLMTSRMVITGLGTYMGWKN